MMLSFGPLEKDRAGLDTGLLTIAKNAYPSPVGYTPMPSLAPYGSDTLPSGCIGKFTVEIAGAYHVFAGTKTALYKLVSGIWEDWSRTTGGAYTTADGNIWRFIPFGTLLIAVNGSDAPQVVDLAGGAANFSALAGSPPVSKDGSVKGDFVFLRDANNPRRLVNCGTTGPNTATSWTIGIDLCDEYIAPDGGEIVTPPMIGEYGIFLQSDGVARRIQLIEGNPYAAFSYEKIEGIKGGIKGYNQVAVPGRIFYLAENGPWTLGADGSNRPIADQRVAKEFLETCDPARLERAIAFADPYSSRVYWAYHSPSAGTAYDRLMGFDPDQNRFFFAEITAQFWAPVAIPGKTLEGLNAQYPSLDAMTVSLDSRQFVGGRPTIGAITEAGELALLSGPSLAPTLRVSPVHLVQGLRALLSQIEVIGDWEDLDIEIWVTVRERMGGPAQTKMFKPSGDTGLVYTRISGRIFEVELRASAGGVWRHLQGLSTVEQADGQR